MVDKASRAESVQTGRYTDVQETGRQALAIVDHPSDDPAPPPK